MKKQNVITILISAVLLILAILTYFYMSMPTYAKIETSHGEIVVKLYTEEAPETTKNFITLAKEGKYDDTIFHRVMNDFMIQGGDFENRNGTGGYSYKGSDTYLKDEFDPSLRHVKGALSMANRGPNTGGSQFFIVQADGGTPWLNGAHSIFGQVEEGMDVVDEIAGVATDEMNMPLKEVVVKTITISKIK